MPIANDLRKSLTDPTPLYFAAGVVDKIREEAPQALASVRETDPREVQAKLTQQAKETQVRVSETLSGIDTDIKKLREQAQHFALQGVGFAAEYAVKAREAYDELAVRGREAVKNWRGEDDGSGAAEVTVERESATSVKIAEPPAEETPAAKGSAARSATATDKAAAATATDKAGKPGGAAAADGGAGAAAGAKSADARTAGGKNGTTKTGTARKTTPAARKPTPKSES
ncbi:hypothetical protein [Streptomyces reniochalinae]|uniref:Heparin-binding hemagglutinin n=1 Tax=Streptomyces reniochalinae TaxID=2250578 RepID=A0A367EJB9_9ACTN|nr:hypothetical protein [Streptomyces reniochalinae]RCG18151.1 hypothetical protein DQ392_16000 [Streptomyces reniochalinae]